MSCSDDNSTLAYQDNRTPCKRSMDRLVMTWTAKVMAEVLGKTSAVKANFLPEAQKFLEIR